ncbi:L,D-transpeptidase [Caballeronia sp. BR00000012568055]|uniref:L,D-transpeptidase n=1 Tax=Caballeronia sp. BR00000012568055 TaxID=2918761 RepID=UPI0023F93966|nr:L,D-transpeptidase [Caballeronia sp. BR00000012568055]
MQKIHVSIRAQTLTLTEADGSTRRYPVSTARNGVGNRAGSGGTPLGLHRVRLKIGENAPYQAVFVARRATGEVFGPELAAREPERDWMLSRIMLLQGMERGVNRGGDVDTLRRRVYIHGTMDEHLIGTPVSFGCVRMNNADIIDLFDRVQNGIAVQIDN